MRGVGSSVIEPEPADLVLEGLDKPFAGRLPRSRSVEFAGAARIDRDTDLSRHGRLREYCRAKLGTPLADLIDSSHTHGSQLKHGWDKFARSHHVALTSHLRHRRARHRLATCPEEERVSRGARATEMPLIGDA
jgi:hypothetical protein